MSRTITPDELPDLAREAHDASGLTQRAAAAELGVSIGTYGQALTPRAGLDAVRIRIVERWGGVAIEGPVYVVRDASS